MNCFKMLALITALLVSFKGIAQPPLQNGAVETSHQIFAEAITKEKTSDCVRAYLGSEMDCPLNCFYCCCCWWLCCKKMTTSNVADELEKTLHSIEAAYVFLGKQDYIEQSTFGDQQAAEEFLSKNILVPVKAAIKRAGTRDDSHNSYPTEIPEHFEKFVNVLDVNYIARLIIELDILVPKSFCERSIFSDATVTGNDGSSHYHYSILLQKIFWGSYATSVRDEFREIIESETLDPTIKSSVIERYQTILDGQSAAQYFAKSLQESYEVRDMRLTGSLKTLGKQLF